MQDNRSDTDEQREKQTWDAPKAANCHESGCICMSRQVACDTNEQINDERAAVKAVLLDKRGKITDANLPSQLSVLQVCLHSCSNI